MDSYISLIYIQTELYMTIIILMLLICIKTQSIQIFLFTLNRNVRYEERKNENNKTEDTGMYIEEDSKLYQCAYGYCFSVYKVRIIDTINNEISNLVAFI